MLLTLLYENPIIFIMVAGALVVSLSVHEFAHAWAAYKLGDSTAASLGRLTLNPTAHLDPIGTVMLLVLGFGWGKPVPFNPYNLSFPKRDSALIALAGPASNFVLAVIFSVLFKLTTVSLPLLAVFFYYVVLYNLFLGVFNLIPVNPLDGFKIVNGLLPYNLSIQWMQTAQYGVYILMLLLITDTIQIVVSPVVGYLLGLLGMSFGL